MAESSRHRLNKPINPYWLIIWYVAFLFCLAIFCIHTSQPLITELHAKIQNLGLETFLLGINRPSRIHEFLIERGDEERWQRIAVYFSALLPSLVIFNVFCFLLTPRYIDYISKTVDSWQKPLTFEGKRGLKIAASLGLFLSLGSLYNFVWGYQTLDKIPRYADAIQLLDSSFYSIALNAAIFSFGVAIVHFCYLRMKYHYRLST